MPTIKTGWLENKNGEKFAPKTLSSQVQTSEGVLLEDKIKNDIDAALAEKASKLLIVTLNEDTDIMSHTSEEIYTHVQNGGTAILKYYDSYYTMTSCESYYAVFTRIGVDESYIEVYGICPDGTYENYEYWYAIARETSKVSIVRWS